LVAVEGGIVPPGIDVARTVAVKHGWMFERFNPPGWEARLHGRQGCLPLRI
jgi:hypothetical protein